MFSGEHTGASQARKQRSLLSLLQLFPLHKHRLRDGLASGKMDHNTRSVSWRVPQEMFGLFQRFPKGKHCSGQCSKRLTSSPWGEGATLAFLPRANG